MPLARVWRLIEGIGKLRDPKRTRQTNDMEEEGVTGLEHAALSTAPAQGFDHAPVGIQAWIEQNRKKERS